MFSFRKIFIFSFLLPLSQALYYPQYFLAYPYKSCLGVSDHYWLDTNTNISDEVYGLYYKSIIVQGLWRFNFTNNQIFLERSNNTINPCSILTPDEDGNYLPLKSVVKLAAGDLDDSFLSLYPIERFEGDSVIINDQGKDKIEQQGFTVKSWALTGSQPFTVFDGEYFTGSSTCILPDEDAKGITGGITIGIDLEHELVVRSVKFGCDSKSEKSIYGNPEKLDIGQNSTNILVDWRLLRNEKTQKFIAIY